MNIDEESITPRAPAERAVRYVLFVCNHNAGRSQMAQAFFERHAPQDVRAESAGTAPAPAIWPAVIDVMREVGIDIAARKPKKLSLEMQLHADWAITMGCGDACPYVPTMVEAWDVPDPAGRPIDDVRAIRDGIEAHVIELIDKRLDAIRSDRTTHADCASRDCSRRSPGSSPRPAPQRRSARAPTRSWKVSRMPACTPTS